MDFGRWKVRGKKWNGKWMGERCRIDAGVGIDEWNKFKSSDFPSVLDVRRVISLQVF